jgi:hypothetical protein
MARHPQVSVDFLPEVAGGMEPQTLALGIGKAADGVDGRVHDLVRLVFAVGDDHDRHVAQLEVGVRGHAQIDDGLQALHQLGIVAEEGEQVVVGQDVVDGNAFDRFSGFQQMAHVVEPAHGGIVHAPDAPRHRGPHSQGGHEAYR